ncbi:MAG: purine permease [Intestinimonas massiliensis]|uniref:uracil-xanthine permease family protein n=1 Tax=Intestinimonas TaxID=1392389 RepID=UPI00242D56D5|nr:MULTISPECIES: nucleobase:cation symporter-2 family protein [Intestinimonas]MCI5561736.1 purine permease [Intestinimonas massiliensis (ex Afouda et al. 2020)]MDY5339356.1 nucleobase:cation symporter-2 family protein [Intestinimonas sp.]
MPTHPNSAALFQYRGVPAPGQLIPLGLQHVVASIVGIVTPAILISNTCGLSPADQTLLIQVSLVITALATLLQLFPLFRRIGAGLPVIMGISFAYVPTLQSIGMQFDLPTILGAELVGGMVAIVFGVFVKQIRPFFPPLVTGTVIFTIGLSLYSTAIRYMASGSNPADPAQFGSVQNWVVAFITFAVVVFFNNFTKGTLKLGAILIGMVVGYLVAWLMGMVSFDSVASAGWFQVAAPLHFGISFEPSACVSLAIVYVVNAVQTMGDLSSTTLGGMDRLPTDRELSGGIIGQGVISILGAFVGGLPTATYSQNVGIVTVNRVINRLVFTLAAAVLLVAGLVPKFSSVLTTIPQSVIGGATVSVFAMITMTGIRMITSQKFTMRSSTVVGLSVALGMGVTQVSGSLAGPGFPGWVTTVFGSSSVVLATMMAIFLNLILPKDPPEEEAQAHRVEAVIEEAAQKAERETQ